MPDTEPSFFGKLTRLFKKAEVPEPEFQGDGLTTETSRSYYVEWLESFGIDPSRSACYQDYLMMDRESPIIQAALDTIADASVSSSEGEAEDVYQIVFPDEEDAEDTASHEEVSDIFSELEERTTIKSDTWSIMRAMSLLGDEFSEIVIDPKEMHVSELKGLPAESMIVVPDEMGRFREEEYAYRQHNETGATIAEFYPWQIVHYAHRVRRTDVYGRSHLASTRRVYKQLQFIEDSMVINRIIRATMRYVHQVPVGGMAPLEARKYVDKYKQDFIRSRRFDREGKLSMRQNPLDEERDFFVPVGKEANGTVTAIQGQSSLDRISDVEYFLKKLFAALRVPPAYLGFEADTHAKSVITTLDVAFGRVVRRAQVAHSMGQRQVYQTELALKKKNPKDINFHFVYNPIGTVDEMRRWQIELLKAQVAMMLKTQSGLIQDDEYLLKKILQVEEEDFKRIMKANKKAKLEQQAEQEKLLAAQGQMADQGAKQQKDMATHAAALDVATHDVKAKIDKKKEIKESRRKVSHKVSQAVEMLMERQSVRRDLLEIYQMAQPMTVTVNGSGISTARLKELQRVAGL